MSISNKISALALLPIILISGCSAAADPSTSEKASGQAATENSTEKLNCVEQFGEVPDEFKDIIAENLFSNITVSRGRLLEDETYASNVEYTRAYKVTMMDNYGKELASYEFTSNFAYRVVSMTATDDGGFMFLLDFQDMAIDEDEWASDGGYRPRLIKCDKNGGLVFDTELESTSASFCFEADGKYYVFGSTETPETDNRGVYSPTDIYAAALDKNGRITKSLLIAGSDYDSLTAAERGGEGFVLSISAQSDDGDFAGSDSGGYPVDWVFTLDGELEITGKEKKTGRALMDTVIGEKDGAPLYKSSFEYDPDLGSPEAYIEYGDFYLVVSEHITGTYENQPTYLNTVWNYSETVYSAYDKNDEPIFRASVDSSPDYDSLIELY